jgi:hypothetical protein
MISTVLLEQPVLVLLQNIQSSRSTKGELLILLPIRGMASMHWTQLLLDTTMFP